MIQIVSASANYNNSHRIVNGFGFVKDDLGNSINRDNKPLLTDIVSDFVNSPKWGLIKYAIRRQVISREEEYRRN